MQCVLQTPRHVCLSSWYEENLSAPPVIFVCICVCSDPPARVHELLVRGEPLYSPRDICMHVCVLQTPRHGCLSSLYEDNLSAPPVVDSVELWRLAHTLTMQHNTAKANRLALR